MSDREQTETGTLHAIMRALPVGVWVAQVPGGELAYANAEFLSIMGMQARDDVALGELAGAYSILDRAGRPYPEDRLPFVRAMQERTTVVVDDIVIARPDGKRAYVRAFGRPIFTPSGVMTHVAVAFIDISAQIEAERAGDVARDRLSAALQHAPIIFFTTDHRGVILVSEGAGLAGLGYVSGELVGQNVFDLYREAPDVLENIRRALAGHSFTVSSQLGPTTLESFMGPLYGEDGKVNGMLGISTDVTERLQLQRQVTHADRMAVLGRLAASIAHEINNPLAYVTESLRIAMERVARLERGASQEELLELRRLLADAAEGSERVRMIARDLKSFAHPDEDTRTTVRIDVAVQTAARLVAKRTQTRARVQLELSGEALVHADENRLVQVFTNLILNAADALSASSAQQNTIRISSSRRGAFAVIEIADSGPGIDESMRAVVFEPFFTTKPVGEGSGLGLHVTRTLVEALGGTIEVSTAPEGGALFSVQIPLSRASVPPPELVSAASPGPTAPPARRPRVLIIDDEPMLARVFHATLEAECDVDIALGGREALTLLLAGKSYDFIFCDLMMSEIGGAQLYAELKARAPGLERKLIFMTGGVYDPAVATFLESVDNRCVDKPFDIRREIFQDEQEPS